jgi:hypothetical protein
MLFEALFSNKGIVIFDSFCVALAVFYIRATQKSLNDCALNENLIMNSNNVLTKNQAAAQLSVSIQTIDNLFKRGDLPRIQVTLRRVGVLQSDLNSYLENRRVTGGAA